MGNARFWEEETREILLDSGRKLLSQIKEEEGELYSSLQNLIRPLLIIFRQFEDSEEERQQWAPLESQKLSEKLKYEDSKYRMKTRFIGRLCCHFSAPALFSRCFRALFPGSSHGDLHVYSHSRHPDPWGFCHLFCIVYEYPGYERNPGY